jgi:hypothetical protein
MSSVVAQPRSLRRLRAVRWRDLRLWVGIGLVIAAMFIGAAILSTSEQRVSVWRATSDMAAGAAVTHVEPTLVVLGEVTGNYLVSEQEIVGRLRQSVTTGELIPRTAVTTEQDLAPKRFITVPVQLGHAPPGLMSGQVVDVWATDAEGVTTLILDQALVASVAPETGGIRTNIGVVLIVDPAAVQPLVAAVRSSELDLISVPVRDVRR